MDWRILISAFSLFAGASLMPAVFLILREKQIPLDAHNRVQGGAALLIAFILLALSVLFLLNAFAQDLPLFAAALFGLFALPLLVILLDRWRASR